ncbi:hypothetical protein DXG01_005267 [Tephrocybe rancida]|nr:hypothetical protein DXG01_005267 [Tephrocybe rancida]
MDSARQTTRSGSFRRSITLPEICDEFQSWIHACSALLESPPVHGAEQGSDSDDEPFPEGVYERVLHALLQEETAFVEKLLHFQKQYLRPVCSAIDGYGSDPTTMNSFQDMVTGLISAAEELIQQMESARQPMEDQVGAIEAAFGANGFMPLFHSAYLEYQASSKAMLDPDGKIIDSCMVAPIEAFKLVPSDEMLELFLTTGSVIVTKRLTSSEFDDSDADSQSDSGVDSHLVLVRKPIALVGISKAQPESLLFSSGHGMAMEVMDASGKQNSLLKFCFSEKDARDKFVKNLNDVMESTFSDLADIQSYPGLRKSLGELLSSASFIYEGHRVLMVASSKGIFWSFLDDPMRDQSGVSWTQVMNLCPVNRMATLSHFLLVLTNKNLYVSMLSELYNVSLSDLRPGTIDTTHSLSFCGSVEFFAVGEMLGLGVVLVVVSSRQNGAVLVQIFQPPVWTQPQQPRHGTGHPWGDQVSPLGQVELPGVTLQNLSIDFMGDSFIVIPTQGVDGSLPIIFKVTITTASVTNFYPHRTVTASKALRLSSQVLIAEGLVGTAAAGNRRELIGAVFVSEDEVLACFAEYGVFLNASTGEINRGPRSWLLWEGRASTVVKNGRLLFLICKHNIQILDFHVGFARQVIYCASTRRHGRVLWTKTLAGNEATGIAHFLTGPSKARKHPALDELKIIDLKRMADGLLA